MGGQMRMPRTEEFPIPARTQLKAGGNPHQADSNMQTQKNKVGFLERIAAVGLQKRANKEEAPSYNPAPHGDARHDSTNPAYHDLEKKQRPIHQPVMQNDLGNGGQRPIYKGEQAANNVRNTDQDLDIPAFLRRR